MIKIASQLLDNISEFAKNNKGLTAGILAGGGLGLLGGAMTPTESEDPDEDAATRAKRRIGQAALLGSIGAAGAGALGYGLETVGNPIEEGGGLSFNKGLSLYTPAAAGVGAGIGGALLDNRAQEAEAMSALKALKLAETDLVNKTNAGVEGKLKSDLADMKGLAQVVKAKNNQDTQERLINAFKDSDLKARIKAEQKLIDADTDRALGVSIANAESDAAKNKLTALLPDVEKGKLPAKNILAQLSESDNLRARLEKLIADGNTSYKSLDDLLEAAGISTTKARGHDLGHRMGNMTWDNIKNIFSKNKQGERQVLSNLSDLFKLTGSGDTSEKLRTDQLNRIWRFLKRNKRAAGLGALGAALTGYLANKD